ncbi:hypothetical protein [Rubrivirga sp.]|uniref:hypothetical protein n=1 Tax=Rubrivirga sp. TaxID=1885344 RepID=UPI003B51A0E1
MTRRLLAAVALALAAASAPSAQTQEVRAGGEVVRTFEVRDGQVYLDGRHLADAVPPGLDLDGFSMMPLELTGPIVPVLEVDGAVYVLEGEKLVPMDASSRPGRGVYILGDVTPEAVAEMPEESMTPIIEEAYMRDVAARNEALYDRMQQAESMESEVGALAARVRARPRGPERDRLREQLRGLISDLLSLKHEIRDEEIAVVAERLDAAREELEDRRGHHDDIVNGRLRELVGGQ